MKRKAGVSGDAQGGLGKAAKQPKAAARTCDNSSIASATEHLQVCTKLKETILEILRARKAGSTC